MSWKRFIIWTGVVGITMHVMVFLATGKWMLLLPELVFLLFCVAYCAWDDD